MPDFRIIFFAAGKWALFWALALGAITFTGSPEVICATPMVWLLALWVGLDAVTGTRHTGGRRWLDVGWLVLCSVFCWGALVGVVTPFLASPAELERGEAPAMSVYSAMLMAAFGVPVCTFLSLLNGWLYARRMGLRK